MFKCVSITKIGNVQSSDVLKVSLVDESQKQEEEALWFYEEAEAVKYVGHEVIVDFRQEVYNGSLCKTINTFTVPTQINTINAEQDFKLYTDAEDNFATISFNDLSEGEELPNAILYCVKQEVKSSQKATWLSLTVRDRMFHVKTLRLFAYDRENDFTGRYVYCSPLISTKYGLQTEVIKDVDGEVPVNPEIDLARKYIQNFFNDRPFILDTINKFELFEAMSDIVDYELGYKVVRLATQLSLTQTLSNITNSMDVKSIQEAFIAEALALTNKTSILSPQVLSCVYASKLQWTDKAKVIRIIDISTEDVPDERAVFQTIKTLADLIIKNKKGVTDE